MPEQKPLVRVALCDPGFAMHPAVNATFDSTATGRVFDLVGRTGDDKVFRASVVFDARHGFRLIPKPA